MYVARRSRAAVAGLALIALLLGACGDDDDTTEATDAPDGTTAASGFSAEFQEVIDAAADEPQELDINNYFSIGGEGIVDEWVDGFNELYADEGIEVSVNAKPAFNMPGDMATLIEENEAGQNASSDLVMTAGGNLLAGLNAGALVEVDYTGFPNVTEEMVALDGAAVEIRAAVPGFVYNTDKISEDEVPETYEELVNTEFRLATTPYLAAWPDLAADELLGEEEADAIMEALGENVDGFVGCGEESRIATGEFDILALDCGTPVDALTAEGQPLGRSVPGPVATVSGDWLAVPANTDSPNLVKMWIDYMMSIDAQEIQYELEHTGSPKVEGSPAADDIAEVEALGVELFEVTPEWQDENAEFQERKEAEYEALVRG